MSEPIGYSSAIRHVTSKNLQSTIKDPKNIQVTIRVIVECKGFRDDILVLAECARVDRH